jgi:hypothetical protein
MSRIETIRYADEREVFLRSRGRANFADDPINRHGVEMRRCLDELPYWKVCNLHMFFSTVLHMLVG